MKYEDWLKRNGHERQEWVNSAPLLTEVQATQILSEVLGEGLRMAAQEGSTLRREVLRKKLLRRGVWVSWMPPEGIEDADPEPEVMIRRAPGGLPTRLRLAWQPEVPQTTIE